MEIPPLDCITSDNVSVSLDGVLYIQVIDSKLSAYGIDELPDCCKSACSNVSQVCHW